MNGTESKAKIFVSLKDNVTGYKRKLRFPAAQKKKAKWTTFENYIEQN